MSDQPKNEDLSITIEEYKDICEHYYTANNKLKKDFSSLHRGYETLLESHINIQIEEFFAKETLIEIDKIVKNNPLPLITGELKRPTSTAKYFVLKEFVETDLDSEEKGRFHSINIMTDFLDVDSKKERIAKLKEDARLFTEHYDKVHHAQSIKPETLSEEQKDVIDRYGRTHFGFTAEYFPVAYITEVNRLVRATLNAKNRFLMNQRDGSSIVSFCPDEQREMERLMEIKRLEMMDD